LDELKEVRIVHLIVDGKGKGAAWQGGWLSRVAKTLGVSTVTCTPTNVHTLLAGSLINFKN